MPRVYISGASGFVGQNLSDYLYRKNIEVVSLPLRDPSFNFFPSAADAMIHLAGKAHDMKNVSVPEEYYAINFDLTKKVYDAFLASGLSSFIFISSVKAVADHTDVPLTESQVPQPLTHYGKSKLMAEEYILNTPLPEGKSFFILRPCMIHGPGNKGNLNLLYKTIQKGIPYPLAAFDNRRSFLSVENLCFVINQFIQNPQTASGIYHVSDDEPLSTNQVVRIIAEELSRKPRLIKINKVVIKMICRVGDFLKLPFSTKKLNKLTEDYIVSNAKIKSVLHKSLPLTSEEGLRVTIRSFIK